MKIRTSSSGSTCSFVVHDLGAKEVVLTAVLKPGVSLTCGCEVEKASPELVVKRRNTSNRRAVV